MFGKYLKSHRRGIAVFILFCGIFSTIFALYRLPVAAVFYAAAICAFFGAIFIVSDYRRFYRRHRQLGILRDDISVELKHFPPPCDLVEEDYQSILQRLYEDRQEMAEGMENRYREMVDYYTIWVHQIKTPIAAMRLILQGGDIVSGAQQQELEEELRRIEQYVEMVLCYLRLNAGTTDYVIREYGLDDIIRQAVRRSASVFIRKKIRLNYKPLGARVVTDEKWLLFVIEQVLSNALKYTPPGGSISITLEKPKTLCIRDTGIGIAPEDLPRIFEKGYTGGNGRTDKKASGIGLYLCRRICSNLGHRMLITSVPESGTEVRLDVKNAELEVE